MDCQPCTLQPAATSPPYYFTFEVNVTSDGRTVKAIRVADAKEADAFQRLPVRKMTPIPEGEPFFFGGVDLNRDGFLDVMLITERGVANSYADYWLFKPASCRYTYLGNYPVFRVDAQNGHLLTYERGGDAGFIFESREYIFSGDKLLVFKSQKQQATANPHVFLKVTRKRINGAMKIVSTDYVRAP